MAESPRLRGPPNPGGSARFLRPPALRSIFVPSDVADFRFSNASSGVFSTALFIACFPTATGSPLAMVLGAAWKLAGSGELSVARFGAALISAGPIATSLLAFSTNVFFCSRSWRAIITATAAVMLSQKIERRLIKRPRNARDAGTGGSSGSPSVSIRRSATRNTCRLRSSPSFSCGSDCSVVLTARRSSSNCRAAGWTPRGARPQLARRRSIRRRDRRSGVRFAAGRSWFLFQNVFLAPREGDSH